MGRHYVEQAKINIENEVRVKEYEDKKLGRLQTQLEKKQGQNHRLVTHQRNENVDHEKFRKKAQELEQRFFKLLEDAKQLENNRNSYQAIPAKA